MGAGMAGMAGMALSSYLNERQRRKATKHAGKTGTYNLGGVKSACKDPSFSQSLVIFAN